MNFFELTDSTKGLIFDIIHKLLFYRFLENGKFRGIRRSVKSVIIRAKVRKAMTDPFGQASLKNLSPDDTYFIIGLDQDPETEVVTIWSKQVDVAPGENSIELSSKDVIYHK